MTAEELMRILDIIQKMKAETNTLELKSAEKGCPQHLYDSLSSFSNQDEGGIIIFLQMLNRRIRKTMNKPKTFPKNF